MISILKLYTCIQYECDVQALYQLYSDPDPVKKLTADRWLQEVQQSTQAWSIAWMLLGQQVD